MERIQSEVVDDLIIHWFEPMVSFELVNSADSQFDFPITLRAFLFRCFEQTKRAPFSDYDVNHKLFSFYLKYGKPQLQTWSLHKMVVVKVYTPFPVDGLITVKFKVYRGSSRTEVAFTLAGLPCMNPNHWISLFLILSKDEQKYGPIVAHLKIMLICYIQEVAKMDIEIAYIL